MGGIVGSRGIGRELYRWGRRVERVSERERGGA
jgi:hypothetical protein